MKLITAVVTPSEFDAIKKALNTFGVTGLTTEVFQRDLTGGRNRVYRGQRFHADLLPHVRIELITPDRDTADLVHHEADIPSGMPRKYLDHPRRGAHQDPNR